MTDPRKSAIVLVDMARDFVEEGGFIANAGGPEYRKAAAEIVPVLARLLDAARAAGVTVVYSTDEHTPEDVELKKWPPHSMKGTKWAEILPELAPQDGDLVLPKRTYSGFQDPAFEDALKARGIETLYITGLHTDCCCRHTSGDAFQKGYGLVWITDALQAFTPEAHESGLEYYRTYYATDTEAQLLTSDRVIDQWAAARATEAAE
ncbi:isochorismatase family protein [Rhodobacterales bacterium HKCCE2091]|nr:isochorismatase family protein [Rhodobacterales bacterium HKCCE2091]